MERLKNRLIYLTSLLAVDSANQKRLRTNINNCWKVLYDQLGKLVDAQVKDDDLLYAHYAMYYADAHLNEDQNIFITNCRATVELLDRIFVPEAIEQGKISSTEMFEYVGSLEKSAVLWNSFSNPKYSNYSDDIKHYLSILPFVVNNARMYPRYREFFVPQLYVLVLSAMNKSTNENQLLRFLKALERVAFIEMIYQLRLGRDNDNTRLPDFTHSVTQLRKEEKTLDEITSDLNDWSGKVTSSEHNRSDLITRFGNRDSYNREIDSYILYNYEYHLMVQSKTGKMRLDLDCLANRVYSRSNSGVEHILPIRSRNEYWATRFSKFSDNEKKSLKHSLGNLVIIQDEKNQKLANKGFDDKKGGKESSLGYKYGTFSEVELAQFDEWNANNILHRGINLVNFIENRWGIKVGNKKDKAAFLGLSFLL